MNVIDKTLYHQIHPFKIATDVIAAFAAVYLFWLHSIVIGLVVAFVPSLMISLFMIRLMDFENQKRSRLGKYVKRYLGRGADTARSLGFLVMLAGGWFHFTWLIGSGFLVIILAWTNGLVYKRQMPVQSPPRRQGR
ncbi:MAG: hypothetical protein M1469_05505 [Bacteroidetes bacterium]|nr:hypothetical protein [Bacteroidota bacterium]MCL5267542.1 hypothetical protein [Bacteroidota bacterium]